MSQNSPRGRDKFKRAVQYFSDMVESHPQKSRIELLQKVQLQLDLSPDECEFLIKYLSNEAVMSGIKG